MTFDEYPVLLGTDCAASIQSVGHTSVTDKNQSNALLTANNLVIHPELFVEQDQPGFESPGRTH